jgi:hypothetical protein
LGVALGGGAAKCLFYALRTAVNKEKKKHFETQVYEGVSKTNIKLLKSKNLKYTNLNLIL